MGKGGCKNTPRSRAGHTAELSWDEVRSHRSKDSCWIVIDDRVYDVTNWQRKHPGGARILGHFGGQDASEVWHAMHTDKTLVARYMSPLLVGQLTPSKAKQPAIVSDFRALRQTVADLGLYRPSARFYAAHLAHIVVLEVAAYCVLSLWGAGWAPYLLTAILLATAQAQAGWTQHDYGHLSVFRSRTLNHWMHYFVIGHLKAASSHWWNFRHNQHHAKPNALGKDPDVNAALLFLLGETAPREWGEKRRGAMPYNWQHHYFWLLGPPTLLPVYFHIENLYFVFKRRDWVDLFWMCTFFVRYFTLYTPLLGDSVQSAFWLYMLMRLLESFWFTLVTQMNHIPMSVERDQGQDWLTTQLRSTCNVHPGVFNDWFTGHLNYQIEHHLFPTMPRHNYQHVKPLAEALCKKHGLQYISKPLGTAFMDIVRSLKVSGRIWYDAYYHR